MSGKSKMTPGPWERRGTMVYGLNRGPGTAPHIATAETVENARAIACLPELVEAARTMIALWPEREDGSIKATPDVVIARNALRRILARIEEEDA